MKTASNWFTVDKEGLAKLLARKGKEFVLYELLQNAWDTGAKSVEVSLRPIEGKPQAQLVVTDDDPDGFRDLAHAWTLFAESEKKADPEKRGRFNLGEKLVLALCHEATIMTTTGNVVFAPDGKRMVGRTKRDQGSEFSAVIRMTREELAEASKAIQRLIPPVGVETVFNGAALPTRVCADRFQTHLSTEIANEEGYLKKVARETWIEMYEPLEGETPSLYEMGIPVVETGDKWHYNIMQKVPLNSDRDNVTPGWLQYLRMLVLNQTHAKISKDDATQKWVRDASADLDVTPEALETVMTHRFTKKRVIADPTDPEGTKRAMSEGYTVVSGGSLSREEWQNVKRDGTMLPAGQVTPSPKIHESPDGKDDEVPFEKWTDGMKRISSWAAALGRVLLEMDISVRIVNRFTANHGAWYGPGHLTLNLARLGHAWFNEGPREEVDRLIIHEFGHHFSSDHLSHAYHDALCKLGAKLTSFALEDPEFFKAHHRRVA